MAYTVKTGDTLSKIAAANGTTTAKIIAANPFLKTNPKYNGGSTIFSGTVLQMPAQAGASTGLNTAVNNATSGNNTGTSTGTSTTTSTSTSTQAATNIDKLDKATLQARFGIAAGVIGADPSLEAVLNQILDQGITSEALMTQMIQGTLWYKNQTDKQRQYAQAMLNQIHQQFITVVRKGRGDRLKETPEMFSGLFWNGQQSVELGLADALGNVDFVAREVVKAEDIVDYTRRDNVADCDP
jgi:LysM repeat protein